MTGHKSGKMAFGKRSPLAVIFFTVFLYLVGFGVVIPIMPLLAKEYGATAIEVGLLMSVYSLMQFIFAPFWGRFSDRVGRRPVLLFCLLGEVFSYILFAYAQTYWLLFLARLLAGFFGASISTASAYISDVTTPEKRSQGMALIGAAFGLGFMVGPAIGGGLSAWLGVKAALLFVSLLYLLTLIFAFFFLQESRDLSASSGLQEQKKSAMPHKRIIELWEQIKTPVRGALISVYFSSSFAMSMMEATLVLLMADRFGWQLKEVSFGFAYVGLISILSQGFLVRRLIPVIGEKRMMMTGVSLMAFSFIIVGYAPSIWWMAFCMTTLALGNSFTNPSVLGSISLVTSKDEQGFVLGTTQGSAALGRIIGPALGGLMYQNVSLASPFVGSFLIMMVAVLIVVKVFAKLPDPRRASGNHN